MIWRLNEENLRTNGEFRSQQKCSRSDWKSTFSPSLTVFLSPNPFVVRKLIPPIFFPCTEHELQIDPDRSEANDDPSGDIRQEKEEEEEEVEIGDRTVSSH